MKLNQAYEIRDYLLKSLQNKKNIKTEDHLAQIFVGLENISLILIEILIELKEKDN